MKGLVGGPLSVGGLGPRPPAPPLKSGPLGKLSRPDSTSSTSFTVEDVVTFFLKHRVECESLSSSSSYQQQQQQQLSARYCGIQQPQQQLVRQTRIFHVSDDQKLYIGSQQA